MKDVTLRNGTVMTDTEFIKERGFGDSTLTEFVATRDDLVNLGDALVQAILDDEFLLGIGASRKDAFVLDYKLFRIGRVMDFLPDYVDKWKEKLREGRVKVQEDLEEFERKCGGDEPGRHAAEGGEEEEENDEEAQSARTQVEQETAAATPPKMEEGL